MVAAAGDAYLLQHGGKRSFRRTEEMSRDFDIRHIDRTAIEHEARRLRAQALASGVRSVRDWTVAAFQRRPSARTA